MYIKEYAKKDKKKKTKRKANTLWSKLKPAWDHWENEHVYKQTNYLRMESSAKAFKFLYFLQKFMNC